MPRPDWVDAIDIPDETPLWRGIVPIDIKFSDVLGRLVPKEGALITQEMSVNIGSETDPETVIDKGKARGADWRLWEFTAGQARTVGCIVDRDPKDDDPSHAVVLRKENPGESRITQAQAKKLIKEGHWVDESPAAPATPPGGAGA